MPLRYLTVFEALNFNDSSFWVMWKIALSSNPVIVLVY